MFMENKFRGKFKNKLSKNQENLHQLENRNSSLILAILLIHQLSSRHCSSRLCSRSSGLGAASPSECGRRGQSPEKILIYLKKIFNILKNQEKSEKRKNSKV